LVSCVSKCINITLIMWFTLNSFRGIGMD
jgi:hypothetical protein